MNDPLRIYHYLTLSRARVLDAARPLTPDQHSQVFPIGFGTLLRTLTHVMMCEWMYARRIERTTLPPYSHWPYHDETPPPLGTLIAAWAEQAEHTRRTIAAVTDWQAPIEYRIPIPGTEDPGEKPQIITATAADIFTQLALHEVHHRAQAINMLRQLGATVGDIDFNGYMYQRRDA
ncbi:MAG TPA: DinB family protein [Phycisphaerales bacterium]|nr:DinB family protein [Phycisphaerales bacterium]